jgi:hypothetical protein
VQFVFPLVLTTLQNRLYAYVHICAGYCFLKMNFALYLPIVQLIFTRKKTDKLRMRAIAAKSYDILVSRFPYLCEVLLVLLITSRRDIIADRQIYTYQTHTFAKFYNSLLSLRTPEVENSFSLSQPPFVSVRT